MDSIICLVYLFDSVVNSYNTLLILCEITVIVQVVLVCISFVFLWLVPHPIVILTNFWLH
jgi:hypothetical protein